MRARKPPVYVMGQFSTRSLVEKGDDNLHFDKWISPRKKKLIKGMLDVVPDTRFDMKDVMYFLGEKKTDPFSGILNVEM